MFSEILLRQGFESSHLSNLLSHLGTKEQPVKLSLIVGGVPVIVFNFFFSKSGKELINAFVYG